MFYNNTVLSLFDKPSNTGIVDNATHAVLVGGLQGNAVIKLTAIVENNVIKQIKYKVHGGVSLIACMCLLTELVKNTTVEYALTVTSADLIDKLGLDSSQYVYGVLATDSLEKLLKK